jgi:hypothetical protein
MDKKIKTGFVITNILLLALIFFSHIIKGVSLFEKKDVIDFRIFLIVTAINFILSCSLVISAIFYKELQGGESRLQNKIILTFGVCATFTIILQRDSITSNRFFLYYMASLVLFGLLNFIFFYAFKIARKFK